MEVFEVVLPLIVSYQLNTWQIRPIGETWDANCSVNLSIRRILKPG